MSDKLLQVVLESLENLKAVDVVSLDVKDRTSVTDYMVVATGTSKRHVCAVADQLVEDAGACSSYKPGVEGREVGEWVLVDLGDVVVHVMRDKTRRFYKLESLWGVETVEQ